jgi:hypothetical protein
MPRGRALKGDSAAMVAAVTSGEQDAQGHDRGKAGLKAWAGTCGRRSPPIAFFNVE